MSGLDSSQKKIISVECNLEEFPIAYVGTKNLKQITQIQYERWIKVRKTKKAVLQKWEVVAKSGDHVPGPFDLDIKRALDQIVFSTGIDKVILTKKISFSLYKIVDILGLQKSGRTYSAIKDSLNRLKTTTFSSKMAFYLKEKDEYVEDNFSLIERIQFNEKIDEKSTRSQVVVFFGSYFLESLKSYYVKPFDIGFYLSLRSPISKRLYGILDKRSYTSKRIIYDLQEIAKIIPIMQTSPSKIKQSIIPGLEELKSRGFLEKLAFFLDGEPKIEIIVRNTQTSEGSSVFSNEERFFVDEIISQLDDEKSREYIEHLVKTVDQNTIYRALSEVKEQQNFGGIKKSKGALFNAKIQRYLEEAGTPEESKDPLITVDRISPFEKDLRAEKIVSVDEIKKFRSILSQDNS